MEKHFIVCFSRSLRRRKQKPKDLPIEQPRTQAHSRHHYVSEMSLGTRLLIEVKIKPEM